MRDYWRPVAESNGFIVLATSSSGTSGGWRGADAQTFQAALNDALGAYNIDRGRVYIWGFSAGAHFVHAIALQNADLFAAYAVNAGVLGAFAGASAPAAALRKIPVAMRIGNSDPLLPQARADRTRFIAAGWLEGKDLSYNEFSGGHELKPGDRQLVWDFIKGFSL